MARAVAVGAIGVAVVATLAASATGGMSEGGALGVAPVAIGVLGVSATFAAVGIAVKTGGVAALSKLRGYREVSGARWPGCLIWGGPTGDLLRPGEAPKSMGQSAAPLGWVNSIF